MFANRTERTFRFVECQTELGNTYAINMIRGKFKGLVFYYGAVRFIEEPNGTLTLKYTYDTIENPKNLDVRCPMFNQFAGELLEYILNNHADKVNFLNDEELERTVDEN